MKLKPTYSVFILVAGIFFLGTLVGRKTAPDSQKDPQQYEEHASKQLKIKGRATSSPSDSRIKVFDTMDTHDFQALSQSALNSSDELENDALLVVLISEWAKKDPYAALEYASELPNRSDLMYEALRQMAQQNPDGALDWISQNVTDSSRRQYLLRAAYKGMALSDPSGSVARVELMSAGTQRDQLLSLTLNEWAKQDIHAAFDWIEFAEIGPQFKHIYNEVMGRYIEQDPTQAAALVSEMQSGDNKLNFASQVATKLAEKDVNHALEWVQTLDGNEKKYALLGVMDRWAAGVDGENALDYILQNSSQPNHKELLSMVAMKLARKSPEKLTDAFDSMNESEQMITAQQLASVYSINDQERGIEWIQSLVTGAVRDEAIKSTITSYQYSNVAQAFSLSETISSSAIRTQQMSDVLTTWAAIDQTAAEQALNASSSLSVKEKQTLLNLVYANLKIDDYVIPAKE